jgi:two-component system phosphate regulon response regulator PhoB
MKILIIEDSLFLRRANERALTRAGHEVISAGDGLDGLRLALEQKPDLVILDLILPKLPGRDVLRQLHGNPDTAAIPVMIVSSLAQSNDQKLLAEGATSYYEKARLMLDSGPDKFVQAANQLLLRSRDTRA